MVQCLIQVLFFSNSEKLYKNCYGVFKKKKVIETIDSLALMDFLIIQLV